MKKFFLYFILIIMLTLSCGLVGCDLFNGDTGYNSDVKEVAHEDILDEHITPVDGVTYYTSDKLSLYLESKGHYFEVDYFYLDGNKRVYDNMYLYEGDYFLMIPSNMIDFYASLSDSADTEYAVEEKEEGYDIQLNVVKTGKYKVIFDVDTMKFDLVYLSEITTPVHYAFKNCSIYSVATDWVEMPVNPSNPDEFYINDFNIEAGKYVSFFNSVHTSNYKITLDPSVSSDISVIFETKIKVKVGGKYNISINRKTYVVNIALVTPNA